MESKLNADKYKLNIVWNYRSLLTLDDVDDNCGEIPYLSEK